MFATGAGILTQKDGVTSDGLQEVFMTNLFGHFLLVSELYNTFIVSHVMAEQLHITQHKAAPLCMYILYYFMSLQ